jgi:4,5-DOPA dioxygenase extradiol
VPGGRLTRREFLKLLGGAAAAAGGLPAARALGAASAPDPVPAGPKPAPNGRVPSAFVAHGAPLLALDPVKGGQLLGWAGAMPAPRKILVVSAHWERAPASLGPTVKVPLIYDFYGFPRELYEMDYPAPASEALARQVEGLLKGVEPVERLPERGLDHGTWVPLRRMYPDASIPVIQLSLPTHDPARLYGIGRALAPLRADGVLILGSGNLTHNLGAADWRPDPPTPAWASDFDAWIEATLAAGDVDRLLDYGRLAPAVRTAHPTREHFVPLLVAAGAAAGDADRPTFPVTGFEFGSIARRCVQFG